MFKKGDRVKCINVDDIFGRYLILNKVYTVIDHKYGLDVGVLAPTGNNYTFDEERFIFVSSSDSYSLTF